MPDKAMKQELLVARPRSPAIHGGDFLPLVNGKIGGAVTPPGHGLEGIGTQHRLRWASENDRYARLAKTGAVPPLSDRSLCLRPAVRRQAQAAFGGRFARLDPGQPPEAWLGIGFRVRSGSPSRGCERRGGYLA